MKLSFKTIALIAILSFLLSGCYSTVTENNFAEDGKTLKSQTITETTDIKVAIAAVQNTLADNVADCNVDVTDAGLTYAGYGLGWVSVNVTMNKVPANSEHSADIVRMLALKNFASKTTLSGSENGVDVNNADLYAAIFANNTSTTKTDTKASTTASKNASTDSTSTDASKASTDSSTAAK